MSVDGGDEFREGYIAQNIEGLEDIQTSKLILRYQNPKLKPGTSTYGEIKLEGEAAKTYDLEGTDNQLFLLENAIRAEFEDPINFNAESAEQKLLTYLSARRQNLDSDLKQLIEHDFRHICNNFKSFKKAVLKLGISVEKGIQEFNLESTKEKLDFLLTQMFNARKTIPISSLSLALNGLLAHLPNGLVVNIDNRIIQSELKYHRKISLIVRDMLRNTDKATKVTRILRDPYVDINILLNKDESHLLVICRDNGIGISNMGEGWLPKEGSELDLELKSIEPNYRSIKIPSGGEMSSVVESTDGIRLRLMNNPDDFGTAAILSIDINKYLVIK